MRTCDRIEHRVDITGMENLGVCVEVRPVAFRCDALLLAELETPLCAKRWSAEIDAQDTYG